MAAPPPRPSRLQRVAAALRRYAQACVWALVAAGLAAFLLLPLAAKRCYLDEKALLVGGAQPTVRCAAWGAWRRQQAEAPAPQGARTPARGWTAHCQLPERPSQPAPPPCNCLQAE